MDALTYSYLYVKLRYAKHTKCSAFFSQQDGKLPFVPGDEEMILGVSKYGVKVASLDQCVSFSYQSHKKDIGAVQYYRVIIGFTYQHGDELNVIFITTVIHSFT